MSIRDEAIDKFLGAGVSDTPKKRTDVNYDGLWEDFWAKMRDDTHLAAMLDSLNATPNFVNASPEKQKEFRAVATVMSTDTPLSDRLHAAMSLSNSKIDTSAAPVHFLSKMFAGVNPDGTVADEAGLLLKIEKDINRLHLDGVQVKEDGKADEQLAGLLRTPEVVRAVKALGDIQFKAGTDWDRDDDAIRLCNLARRQSAMSERA